MKSASVTELKNQLSAHLRMVIGGEPLLVTDRRKPIALLQPLPEGFWKERMAGLVMEGVVSPPQKVLNIEAFLRTPRGKSSKSLTSAVIEDRDGR